MGRSPCCDKAHTNKGAWTKEEDQRLVSYIQAHGEGCWRSLPKAAGLMRCGKSCRLRWINYLRPDLKRGNFTEKEDELIIKLHGFLGNKWSLIAGRLPGRTDNEIKNYWNTHIKRKLLSRGIDPHTHHPITAATAAFLTAPEICSAVPETADTSDNKCHSDSCSGGGSPNYVDLNLDLSISLPYYSSPQPSPYSDDASTAVAAVRAPEICFCYRLGFRGGDACVCESLKEHLVLRLAIRN
ncbi:hypothetical protein IEQ34_019631 [Dendrobium chrysotoxum]|uniref:Uncharacterized protein n=1 Tax=Dendrobium chrysotoxum TaxID=161865 RepID=A0AAV7G9A5_DENCH|nr:hypothetical protein IEQ34_019631 [Dendrobium chrysotoxum]